MLLFLQFMKDMGSKSNRESIYSTNFPSLMHYFEVMNLFTNQNFDYGNQHYNNPIKLCPLSMNLQLIQIHFRIRYFLLYCENDLAQALLIQIIVVEIDSIYPPSFFELSNSDQIFGANYYFERKSLICCFVLMSFIVFMNFPRNLMTFLNYINIIIIYYIIINFNCKQY